MGRGGAGGIGQVPANAGDEVGRIDRLDEDVDHSELSDEIDLGLKILSSIDENCDMARLWIIAELAQDIDTVNLRHHEIED